MLDDFKSVLQRLGGMKLDGTTEAKDNSLILESSKSENMGENNYSIDADSGMGSKRSSSHRQQRLSLSGRLLHEGEVLDDAGRSRRRQSMAASAVGSVGVKIRRLRDLPFMQDSVQREARHNMKENKKRGSTQTTSEQPQQQSRPLDEANPQHESISSSREPWEQVDFITALVDPEVEGSARRHHHS
jgi:hypothetical protein